MRMPPYTKEAGPPFRMLNCIVRATPSQVACKVKPKATVASSWMYPYEAIAISAVQPK